MQRDTASDTTHDKPSLRHIAETDYWSDENICRTQFDQTNNLWQASLTTNTKMTESKDHTIDDAQLTRNQDNQDQHINDDGKNKNVHFDESRNQTFSDNRHKKKQINNNNFAPGSNISPSLLTDTQSHSNSSQTIKKGKSGRKRSQVPASAGQNDDISNISPLQKRQKFSKTYSNNNNNNRNSNNDLSFDELQAIQNEERNQFQAELYRDGCHTHIYGTVFKSDQTQSQCTSVSESECESMSVTLYSQLLS